jgi:hypothetical protein
MKLMRKLVFGFLATFGLVSTAVGADVMDFELECIDRQEVSPDNIYLKIVVDGSPISFGGNPPTGFDREFAAEMTEGTVLRASGNTLAKLRFANDVVITVMERDNGPTEDDLIGTVEVRRGQQEEKTFRGGNVRKFEYKLRYRSSF